MRDANKGRRLIAQLCKCQRRLALVRRKYREGLYEFIEQGCCLARELEGSEKAWALLIDHKFWNTTTRKPTPADRKDPLRLVLTFIMRATQKHAQKRVSKYVIAIKQLYDLGIKPEQVAIELKKNRISSLCKAASEGRKTGNRKGNKAKRQNFRLALESKHQRKLRGIPLETELSIRARFKGEGHALEVTSLTVRGPGNGSAHHDLPFQRKIEQQPGESAAI